MKVDVSINPLIPKIEKVPRKVVHLYLETKGFHLYQDGMTLAEKKLIHSTFVTNSFAKSKTSGLKLFHILTCFHRRVSRFSEYSVSMRDGINRRCFHRYVSNRFMATLGSLRGASGGTRDPNNNDHMMTMMMPDCIGREDFIKMVILF